MTDAPDLTPEPDAVRRLLADARHDGSTPPEVVLRLDGTLAALVTDRGDAPLAPDAGGHRAPAPVVDLGARRRRTAGFALLAAAAVVVAGVALGQGLPRMSGGDDAGSAAGGDMSTSQERELGAQDDSGGASDSGSGAAEMGPESLKSTAPVPEAGYPTLSSSAVDLDDDLLDLRSAAAARSAETGSDSGVADTLAGCGLRGIGQGRRLLAQVDGQSGLVVFRRPDGPAQQTDLYVCGNPAPVRTLTLPAP